METDVSQDFQDYWNEYKIVASEEKSADEDNLNAHQKSDDEGLDEADWLEKAGFPHLKDSYYRGQEIEGTELGPIMDVLSLHQANAVRRRVNSLNQTIKHRPKTKPKKPDIRDVFKNMDFKSFESHGNGPHIPDSTIVLKEDSDPHYQPYSSLPDYINIDCTSTVDAKVALKEESNLPRPEIFRRVVKIDRDVVASENVSQRRTIFRRNELIASNSYTILFTTSKTKIANLLKAKLTYLPLRKDYIRMQHPPDAAQADGITMLAFQRFGTMRESYPKSSYRSAVAMKARESAVARSSTNISSVENNDYKDKDAHQFPSLGFERMWNQPTTNCNVEGEQTEEQQKEESVLGCTWVDTLADDDLVKLRPLLFVELSAIFDKASCQFPKIKQRKRKRKEEGNIFGCSLSSLVEKDGNLIKDRVNHVPLIFCKLLNEMEKRALAEEGVLRVAGNKAKIDNLCQTIEKDFYIESQKIDQLLQRCAIHDLTAVFKKLLRDLPEPLLTNEMINLFYQSHNLPECEKVLNLLILLLPVENRLTLLAIISFMRKLVEHEAENKMTKHNVAMILAPSIFPPRSIQIEKNIGNLQAQVGLAAISCRITETLMSCHDRLNKVPCTLISQLRHINDLDKYRLKENSPMKKFLGNKKGNKNDVIMRKIENEVDFQEGVIRVNAPQFNLSNVPIALNENTTAGDVVLKITEIGSKSSPRKLSNKQLRRKDIKQRVLTELAPNGNLSCLLSTADEDMALRTHFLYEVGGNLGQRCLESTAIVIAVYQINPNAKWLIKCDHRNAVK